MYITRVTLKYGNQSDQLQNTGTVVITTGPQPRSPLVLWAQTWPTVLGQCAN